MLSFGFEFRYADIFLGLILFLSTLSLLYGGYFYSQVSIIAFITSSLGVMISYWSLYAYASYNQDDLPVYDDQVRLEYVMVKTILRLALLVSS